MSAADTGDRWLGSAHHPPKVSRSSAGAAVARRSFSLRALQQALAQRLHHQPVPSMPTLKKWSSRGDLDGMDLNMALEHLLARIQSGQVILKPRASAKAPHGATPQSSLMPQPGQNRPGAPPAVVERIHLASPHPQTDVRPSMEEGALEEIRRLHTDVHGIKSDLERLASRLAHNTTTHDQAQAPHPELLRAIEQLDATRRHLLVQWHTYREMAEGKEAANPQKATGTSAGGPDFLEWQRLQGRIHRMEQMLELIWSHLQDGSRQEPGQIR